MSPGCSFQTLQIKVQPDFKVRITRRQKILWWWDVRLQSKIRPDTVGENKPRAFKNRKLSLTETSYETLHEPYLKCFFSYPQCSVPLYNQCFFFVIVVHVWIYFSYEHFQKLSPRRPLALTAPPRVMLCALENICWTWPCLNKESKLHHCNSFHVYIYICIFCLIAFVKHMVNMYSYTNTVNVCRYNLGWDIRLVKYVNNVKVQYCPTKSSLAQHWAECQNPAMLTMTMQTCWC